MDFHWPALFNAEADAEGTRDLRLAQNLFHEQLTVSTFELELELELELIQTQMAQKPMLRAEVGMRVRCANKASAE